MFLYKLLQAIEILFDSGHSNKSNVDGGYEQKSLSYSGNHL